LDNETDICEGEDPVILLTRQSEWMLMEAGNEPFHGQESSC
jgi:hypothetical protein